MRLRRSGRRIRKRAREIQSAVSEQFDQAFRAGLAVIGFEKTEQTGDYLLGRVGMKIESFVLRQMRMPLVHFFETSFSRTYERDILMVEARANGLSGWGEITAGENPFYNEEWTESAWIIAKNYAAPRLVRQGTRERGGCVSAADAHSRA